jgi:hypothetical protein
MSLLVRTVRRRRAACAIFSRFLDERDGGVLSRGFAGSAALMGGRLLFSLDRLDIRRHRLFQPFEPWQRRLRSCFSFELALAAEHVTCCILETYSSAHNLSLQLFENPLGPGPFPLSSKAHEELVRSTNDTITRGTATQEFTRAAGKSRACGSPFANEERIQPPKRRCLRLAEFHGAPSEPRSFERFGFEVLHPAPDR